MITIKQKNKTTSKSRNVILKTIKVDKPHWACLNGYEKATKRLIPRGSKFKSNILKIGASRGLGISQDARTLARHPFIKKTLLFSYNS